MWGVRGRVHAGQTLGGDHGGGSPEEVDSVLVAIDIGALHRWAGVCAWSGVADGCACVGLEVLEKGVCMYGVGMATQP